MSDSIAFVSSLQRIAADARADGTHRATAAFDIYRHRLYRQLDIDPARRPTTSAKMIADCVLSDLRQSILKAEVESAEPLRAALTAVRQRVDMARRALAAQMAEDDIATAPLIGAYEWPAYPLTIPIRPARRSSADMSRTSATHSDPPRAADAAQPAGEDCRSASPMPPSRSCAQ